MKRVNIRQVIYDISESVDKETALKNENTFYSIILSYALMIGALAHFIVQYLYLGESFLTVVKGSAALSILALVSISISFISNEVFKMYLYSIEVSLIFAFINYMFFDFLGPAIVLVGLFFLITSLIYSRIEIIIIQFISILLVLITSSLYLETFKNWTSFYIAQVVVLLMILVSVIFVYKVYRSRQDKIEKQYEEILLSELRLEFLSYNDHLTGLYNRRYYEESLVELDNVENLPLSFVFADVNALKLINDEFGHAFGDELIKTVANSIKDSSRSSDMIARIGGDEFVILLPKTDSIVANGIVKRIDNILSSKQVAGKNISVSFGIATKYNVDESSLEVLKNAEDIMYENKRNTR